MYITAKRMHAIQNWKGEVIQFATMWMDHVEGSSAEGQRIISFMWGYK